MKEVKTLVDWCTEKNNATEIMKLSMSQDEDNTLKLLETTKKKVETFPKEVKLEELSEDELKNIWTKVTKSYDVDAVINFISTITEDCDCEGEQDIN